MDQVSVVYSFECDSTLLVNVPLPILHRPVLRPAQHYHGYTNDGHDEFMKAFPLLDNLSQSSNCESDKKRQLSVMRMIPVRGSKSFHRRFFVQCELYCRLCHRLRRAVEWILQKQPDNDKRLALSAAAAAGGGGGACSTFDVDYFFRVVYPLEPTAFVAAAFALPLLFSVSLAVPADDEAVAGNDKNDASHSLQLVENLPYCFFYNFPESSLFCRGNDSFSDAAHASNEASRTGMFTMSLLERVTSVFNALGVCGAVPPVHSTLSICNRTKIGLTLAAYLESRLPGSVTARKSGGSSSTNEEDLFSRWSDDILWRLLGSLVSALAVVHASGFHFRGEISADDVLCFALPDGCTNDRSDETFLQEQKGLPSIGQRFTEWVDINQSNWLITEATPAHRVFFMFATLPRSLFLEESQEPSLVALAQRRDTAAVGRILATVLQESSRRRGAAGGTNCPELFFVAERMAAVGDGEGEAMPLKAPAQRFAQLQAVQLRTHIWLLRLILDERDRQLAAAITSSEGKDSHYRKKRVIDGGKVEEDYQRKSALLSPSSQDKVSVAKLQERERLVSEREKKLDHFLELYEITAERLDQLPAENHGFERFKKSLEQPFFLQTATVERERGSTANASSSLSASLTPQAQSCFWPKSARGLTPTDSTLLNKRRQVEGTYPSSENTTSGNVTINSCSLSSRPITGNANVSGRERRPTDMTPRRWVPQATPAESVSQRGSNATASSFSFSQLNCKAAGNVLSTDGISATPGVSRPTNARKSQNGSSVSVSSTFVGRKELTSPAAAVTAAAADPTLSFEKGNLPTRPPSTKQAAAYSAAAIANTRRITPLRKQQGFASVTCDTSRAQSPGVSTPVRSSENKSSSMLLLSDYKPSSRTSLASAALKSLSGRTLGALQKVLPLRSGGAVAKSVLPGQQSQSSNTPRSAKDVSECRKTSVGCTQSSSSFLLSSRMKVQSTRSDFLKYKNGSKDSTSPVSPRAEMGNETQASFLRTPAVVANKKKIKEGDSAQVIKVYCDGSSPLPLNNFHDQSGSLQGDKSVRSSGADGLSNSKRSGLSAMFSLSTTTVGDGIAAAEAVHQSSPNTHRSGVNDTSCEGLSLPCGGYNKDLGKQQEQEGLVTPRVARLRLANDGWVNDHLQKLEQLRHVFRHSELTKSARETLRAKALARSGGSGGNNSGNGNGVEQGVVGAKTFGLTLNSRNQKVIAPALGAGGSARAGADGVFAAEASK